MASSGPNNPGTGANVSGVGSAVWLSPSFITSSDNVRSEANSGISGIVVSQWLQATNFGFTIPTGATIDGIEVNIERNASYNSVQRYTRDNIVKLIIGGSVVGTSNADTVTKWPNGGDAVKTYGGSTDLWGNSIAYTDVNASNFGVALSVETRGLKPAGCISAVDNMTITVYYTAGGGTTSKALLLAGN